MKFIFLCHILNKTMDYEPGKRGRKPLHRTPEERRELKKQWEAENPERVFEYRRTAVLSACIKRAAFPTRKTIERYNFTRDDLDPLYELVLAREELEQ